MKRTTNGFKDLTNARFRQSLAEIVTSMTGNAHFTSLQTQVTALATAADAYYVLDTKAAKRDKDVLLARNAARAGIISQLHQLGFNVSAIANGDSEVLSSSGFPFTQPKQKSGPMVKPKPPKVMSGVNNGTISVKTQGQKGMKSVNFYITADPAAVESDSAAGWNIVSWNGVKYDFTQLTAGTRYHIKVGLVGVRGQEVISDAIPYIAQ